MYVCMFNLTYFVSMSYLFFKIGSASNILSLILFSIGILIMLATFLKFAIDPYLFGYFRFSFNIKSLAMQHYFLIILMTITSIILLFTFSKYTYISIAPPLILLLYTLIYRPYREIRNNLRYAFNLLAISSFLGLRAYA